MIRTLFRLLASVPPVIFAILVRELGAITDYAGTTGFMIGFAIPAMLYLASKRKAIKKYFSKKTFYASYASYDNVAWTLVLFGTVMVIYVVSLLVRGD